MKSAIDALVQELDLSPHPEGGFFRETYRSSGTICGQCLSETHGGERSISTAIYYLLPQGQKSKWHRIKSDEVWFFHLGGPLDLVELDSHGRLTVTRLGPDLTQGHTLQRVVPAGVWFGAIPCPKSEYSLVSCTVAPGFDFQDFEMADTAALRKSHPEHAIWINTLGA